MSDAHVKKGKTASTDKLDELESLQQPGTLSLLTILTSFAYSFYWFYKTWRDLSFYAGQRKYASASAESLQSQPIENFANISPMLRTIGLFIPFWHIYLCLQLLKILPSFILTPIRFPGANRCWLPAVCLPP